jgi:hypothetical protein
MKAVEHLLSDAGATCLPWKPHMSSAASSALWAAAAWAWVWAAPPFGAGLLLSAGALRDAELSDARRSAGCLPAAPGLPPLSDARRSVTFAHAVGSVCQSKMSWKDTWQIEGAGSGWG